MTSRAFVIRISLDSVDTTDAAFDSGFIDVAATSRADVPDVTAAPRCATRVCEGVTMAGERNVLGGELEPCGTDPLTGFYRDGCCSTGPEDLGSHTSAPW
jgi:hypothetical protein